MALSALFSLASASAQEIVPEAPPPIAASDALQQIIADHWAWTLAESPLFATSLGVRDYDDRLGDASLAAHDRQMEKTAEFAARLEALNTDGLSADERINHKLLLLDLKNDLAGAEFGGKYLILSGRGGPHRTITGLPDRVPFFTRADYKSYLARLADAPRYLDEATETLRAGVTAGWVQACEPLAGAEEAIRFHTVAKPEDSVLMKPFATRPASISERDWRRMKTEAEQTIKREIVPALTDFADFAAAEYIPACREAPGALNLPNGLAYYAHRAAVFTTTDKTPDEIHALGVSEVTRIRSEMQKVIKGTGFDGDFKAFQEFLRSDPQFYAKTPEQLMAANALVAKKADGALTQLFTQLPRMPYTLKEVPADIAEGTTTAFYEPPAGDGSRPGVYRVNTSKLDTRPLFEVEALTLHEAVPGHHFQIALAQEADLPNFRKFGFFTAFVEGWGLYAESLGLDAGFYQDPYSNFGRLSYEMWRACRLVVDTGIHAKGWSKQQAIDYMAENTALSLHNIEAEVNRYIAGPGQALAYKMGELKMQELRKRAAKALGPAFDLRRFNDALLENGAVPLSVLEENIDAWIAAERG
jgi:uncharacterized protein (DUF885 family)